MNAFGYHRLIDISDGDIAGKAEMYYYWGNGKENPSVMDKLHIKWINNCLIKTISYIHAIFGSLPRSRVTLWSI